MNQKIKGEGLSLKESGPVWKAKVRVYACDIQNPKNAFQEIKPWKIKTILN